MEWNDWLELGIVIGFFFHWALAAWASKPHTKESGYEHRT